MQKKSPRRAIFLWEPLPALPTREGERIWLGTPPRPPHKGGRRDMVGRSCHLPLWGGREGFLVLPVIRCHLQRPDVRLHRLLAACGVLLRTVGGLVSGHLRGVFEAGVDSSAMRAKQHLRAAVLRVLTGF